ncbi:ABC transporter ATP-binding protein [Brevibacillus ruminantium]|uniref:ABC transporter ATP-binding protein n=1 Tax=Brevibacillus ruminantium TaxID=2950604 RepID=A0ABY4WGD3_9BACL|nr:ABC transporter ATP-binding protein [Brevibacillus ruminantium]USG66223.1 ABC transporter ATP-binding protein [Brevibacillus ruminantium]
MNSAYVKGLYKQFGEVKVLREVELQVGSGEFVALLGPSGCGKTTLLRLLAGFEQPTSGEVWINGQLAAHAALNKPPEERRVGMVFQSFALWPHMTIFQNVLFPLQHQREVPESYRKNPRSRVEEVLEMVGLGGMGQRYPSQLSGGQRQRVALARAIVFHPSLLLMDEPLSSLDVELRVQMRKEIQHLHRELGASIVYVTHDQSEALAMADRIVVMKDGRIEQDGTPDDIYFAPESPFVARFVGKANFLPGVWSDSRTFQLIMAGRSPRPLRVSRDFSAFKAEGVLPVRPEQIRLHPRDSQPSREAGFLEGQIKHVQFQGREWLYTIAVGAEELEVAAGPGERFAYEENVWVEFCI